MDQMVQVDAPTGVLNVSTFEDYSIHDVFLAVANYLSIAPPEVTVVPLGADGVPQVVLDPTATQLTFG
jgi:UDP-glucose 4-epimerase